MSKKILLADDSVTIQKVISITFAEEDYDLEIVGDGESAVSKIKEIKPDLIMADISMPKKNGYEVCEIVKNDPELKHIPVMLLAGTFEPLNEEEAKRVGADDHMVKPFESQEIIDRVEDVFARSPAEQPPAEEAAFEAAPPTPEVKPPAPPEVWEEGDFIGTEEPAGKEGEALWGGAILEEPEKGSEKKEPEKMEEEFMDLELGEEELEPIEEIEEVEEIEEDEEIGEIKGEEEKGPELPEAPELPEVPGSEFEIQQEPEPFPTSEAEPFEAPEPSVQPPEEVEEREDEEIGEIKGEEEKGPELPEAPELPEVPGSEFEIQQEPEPFPAPEAEPFAAPEEELPVTSEEEPSVTPEAVVQATEEVVEKAKERIEEVIAERVEKKVEEVLAAKEPEVPAIPKEKVEEIVAKLAKGIVEEVVWEVIPDIAEEFIKEEIRKAKEAMSGTK